jgi:chemotaxis protein CheD
MLGTSRQAASGQPGRGYGEREWQRVVGIAEMAVSRQPGAELITYALGSCLGIAIHDPVAGVGGLLHVMLPLSTIDPEKAATNPCMFVDTGVQRLFLEAYRAGARKERLEVCVAGGASLKANGDDDHFQIGKRNVRTLRKLLSENGIRLRAEDVGGSHSRTMVLAVGSGHVTVRAHGEVLRL